jgi:hypothetical protein
MPGNQVRCFTPLKVLQYIKPEGKRRTMKQHLKTWGVIALAVLFARTAPVQPPEADIRMLLPTSEDVDLWSRHGDTEEYSGDDLYIYINGGAEIYQEYGFEKVALQDYSGPAESTVSLEIYRMSDPAAAFGIYSFKAGDKGQPLDLGLGGRLEGYYLNFWKGPFLVTITGFDEKRETVEGILALGRATAEKISSTGREPDIIALLPTEGLMEAGREYVRGQLGLYNLYPFSPQNIFKVREAVKGSYTEGYDLYILSYQDSEEASDIFISAGEALEKEARFVQSESQESKIHALDNRGVSLTFRLSGRNIVIALSPLGFQITDRASEAAASCLNR